MTRSLRATVTTAALTVVCALGSTAAAPAAEGYVAHEWGTFTSVQGADGVQLAWRALQDSDLPPFVYNWSRPGLGRIPMFPGVGGKGVLLAKQRMETPVIYFHSEKELQVDVSVRFPGGFITEWYPQAREVGPATLLTNSLDPYAFASPDSRIEWSGIRLQPNATQDRIPAADSPSHYFAARTADAAVISANSYAAAAAVEFEKFLFYRGVGRFSAPLNVQAERQGILTLTNTGEHQLTDLFVLEVSDGTCWSTSVPSLPPQSSTRVQIVPGTPRVAATEDGFAPLRDALVQALIDQGLYASEAEAMVHTWKDSWLAEPGLRVLYILPREWTDTVLPLQLNPAPRELARVMVGRAEIIAPSVEDSLRNQVLALDRGDPEARAGAVRTLRKLGRFAEPALQLALNGIGGDTNRIALNLISELKPAPTQASR